MSGASEPAVEPTAQRPSHTTGLEAHNRTTGERSWLVGNAERLFERGIGRDHDTEHQFK